MIRQFPLDLRWPPHQRLDAFWPGANVPALQGVTDVANGGGGWLYLCGTPGTGKSHLLVGGCRVAVESGR
ncbi:MAG: DnaA regulatory inactivator Hda, partial [Rhodanobacteraceae bacterium]